MPQLCEAMQKRAKILVRREVLRLILLGIWCVLLSCSKEKEAAVENTATRRRAPLAVDAFIVKPSTVSEVVEVAGTLLPAEETLIRPEVSGRVVQLDIPEGAIVDKGKLLAKLFDADLQAQLQKLKVQLQIADKTVERQRELLAINGISQQDYDLSTLDADNLRADINALQIAIDKTEIRAPYRGQVGLRNISMGAYISPADVITTIRKIDEFKLEFAVAEKYAPEVERGYAVTFRVDGGTRDFPARVIASEGNVNPTTRTLRVRARVTEQNKELVPGVFARVRLLLSKNDEALMIPSQAVIPQARTKEVILFKNDSVLFQSVETGMRDSAYVQVLSGLEAGDTIITTGLMAIRPGTTVKITNVISLPGAERSGAL